MPSTGFGSISGYLLRGGSLGSVWQTCQTHCSTPDSAIDRTISTIMKLSSRAGSGSAISDSLLRGGSLGSASASSVAGDFCSSETKFNIGAAAAESSHAGDFGRPDWEPRTPLASPGKPQRHRVGIKLVPMAVSSNDSTPRTVIAHCVRTLLQFFDLEIFIWRKGKAGKALLGHQTRANGRQLNAHGSPTGYYAAPQVCLRTLASNALCRTRCGRLPRWRCRRRRRASCAS